MQTELFTGRELRDIGINRAVDHANNEILNWSEIAYDFLKKYILRSGEFMAEDVINASSGIVPKPPDTRAWGAVIVRAKKDHIIKSLGFQSVKNPQAHRRPATVWIKQ
jgi:hypothetical protein